MKKIDYRPQHEFPHLEKAKSMFAIHDGICFAYGDTFYTYNAPIPPDFLIHEQHHSKQQALIGKDEWWDRFFKDPKFRLEQELECYRKQLNSIKDRNLRFTRRLKVIDDLSSDMYGAIISKQELLTLLK